jgi:hypothetical protein
MVSPWAHRSPDPMSSKSGSGTPSSSARWLGAPAKGTAADPLNGGALTVRWTSPADEQAREQRRSLSAAARAVARSGEERGGEWRKWLGFRGERPHRGFVPARDARHRWSQMNDSHVFGLVSAQVGGEKVGPGLRRVLPVSVQAGPDWN